MHVFSCGVSLMSELECAVWLGDQRSVDISLALLVRVLLSLWWLHLHPLGPAPFL